jgi:hypothetical protein
MILSITLRFLTLQTIPVCKPLSLPTRNWPELSGMLALPAGKRPKYKPTAQTRYYTGLKNVEPNVQPQHRNKFQEKKPTNHRPSQGSQAGNKSKPDTNGKSNNRPQKYCEIHGKCNHTTAQCEVIQKLQTEYQSRPSNKNNSKNNEQLKYNTRSNAKKENRKENNNLALTNHSDEASSINSENNHIEEVFQVEDKTNNDTSNEVSTEVQIQCCGSNVKHLLLGLLDTGATGIFVKREALKGIDHQVEQVNLKVKGRYSHSQLKEIAIFDIKLPNFCGSFRATVRAYIEESSIGRHDIVLGIRFIK